MVSGLGLGTRREAPTLLVGNAASTGDLGLERAHEGGGAEAVDVGVGAAGGSNGGFGHVLSTLGYA